MSSLSQPMADVHQPQLSLPGPTNFIVASGVQQAQNESPLYRNVNAIRVMGIMEVVLGLISIILGIVTVIIVSNQIDTDPFIPSDAELMSQGLWCGVMILVAGVMGITLKKHATRCLHIANMIFSIMCSFIALAALVISIINVFLSLSTSHTAVWIHATLSVINFVLLILTIVHACFCCTGACYQRTSEGSLSIAYLQQHNAGFVQGNVDPTTQLRGTLPCSQFEPLSAKLDKPHSNAESQPAYEEIINMRGIVLNSPSTGYEAPNLTFTTGENASPPYTAYEQRNQTETEPEYSDRNSTTADQQLLGKQSAASSVRDQEMVLNEDRDYVEPNRIEYGQVPDAENRDSYQASGTSSSDREQSEKAVPSTDAAYLSLA